jgi:uridine kinase
VGVTRAAGCCAGDPLAGAGQGLTTRLIGIDGAGGSGKSTHARNLSDKIVSTDDFITAPWEWYDFERLRSEVIEPLLRDERARYRRMDWEDGELKEWHVVEPGGVVVIEGVGALDVRLRDAYHHRIWVETPREICFRRGLERDGDEALPLWQAWSEKEQRYWAEQQPRDAADEIVDGSGR